MMTYKKINKSGTHFAILLMSLLSACSGAQFSKGGEPAAAPSVSVKPTVAIQAPVPTPVPTPSCNLNSDYVKLKFPDDIQSCIDKGRLWDFTAKSCSLVSGAKSFACTFEGVLAVSNNDPSIAAQKANGFKLVGCGEREKPNKTKIYISQFIKVDNEIDKDTCAVTGGLNAYSYCFVSYSDPNEPLLGISTTAEKLHACMQEQ